MEKVTVIGAGKYGSMTALRIAEYDIVKEVVAVFMQIIGEDNAWANVLKVMKNPKLFDICSMIDPEKCMQLVQDL